MVSDETPKTTGDKPSEKSRPSRPMRRGRRSGRGRRGRGHRHAQSAGGEAQTAPLEQAASADAVEPPSTQSEPEPLPGNSEAHPEATLEPTHVPAQDVAIEASVPPAPIEREPSAPLQREFRPASPVAVQTAIEEVNRIIDTLRETIDDMEEVLETLELAERQKDADEHDIEALRRSLRQLQHPRDGGHFPSRSHRG